MLISHVFPQMLFLLLDCNDKHQRLWYFFQFLWEWRHIPPAMYSLRYQSHFLKLVDLMMRTAEQIFSKWCLLPMRMLMVQHQLIYWSLKHSAPCIYRNSSSDLEHKLVEQSLATFLLLLAEMHLCKAYCVSCAPKMPEHVLSTVSPLAFWNMSLHRASFKTINPGYLKISGRVRKNKLLHSQW